MINSPTNNLSNLIIANADSLQSLLQQSEQAGSLHGLGNTDATLSFDQVDELYNKNITTEEKQAWVWYKRRNNLVGDEKIFLASGWKKYIIPRSEEEEHVAKLVKNGVLFFCNAELLPFPIYTYGNMYDRQLRLEQDKPYILDHFGEPVYERQKAVIEAAKPRMLTVTNPDPKERPVITVISKLANDSNYFSIREVREQYMDVEKARELTVRNGAVVIRAQKDIIKMNFDGNNTYDLVTVFIKWLYTLNGDTDFDKSSAAEIVDYYIYNKALRDDSKTEDMKAEVKMVARLEGERLFARFLHEVLTFEDQQKLDFTWNRIYNGRSEMNYTRVPVGFSCSARFKSGLLQITEAQRQGIAFQEAMGSGINAFDVGVGKTMTAICTLAQMMYSGKSKRPLVVVPKPTYQKWINELVGFEDRKTGEFVPGVLSGTGITINAWFNLGSDILKQIDVNSSVPEQTITLVTYEGFKRIGFGAGVSDEMLTELVNVLEQEQGGIVTAREEEKMLQKYREMIGVGQKNTVLDIDSMGFDYAIIDEAHRCKNVFSSVKADKDGNKRYQIQSATSETGQKAFLLLTFLQRIYGRNVMLLTATPFTNSPLEIYSMLSLVAYDSLREMGISNLKEFFDLFVLPTIEYTANYKEEIVQKEVIKSYTNRLILSRLIYNHILYKTGEEAGVQRPTKVNLPLTYEYEDTNGDGIKERLKPEQQVLTYISMNAMQRNNQDEIVQLAKNATKGNLNMGDLMRALGYSLDNALSPYLYKDSAAPDDYLDFVENSPKIKYVMDCIASVKKWHEDRQEPVSGQIIYMNRGKQFFGMIKEYLEKEIGFKRGQKYDRGSVDEVEIITSEISEARKEAIKEAFLDGVVKIVIGTATIREGIDLQKRGTAIYNCYPEWNPTDIRQLEGRIWRQGNMYRYVRIVLPLVQDSMDVFVFQKLEEKTSRINDIWAKADRGNVLDLESLDPQEVKLALISDVDRLVAIYFDQEKQELNKQYHRIENALDTIRKVERDINFYRHYRSQLVTDISRFRHVLSNSRHIIEPVKPAGEDQRKKDEYEELHETYEKAVALKDFIIQFETSAYTDKELLAAARKIQMSNNTWFSLQYSSYNIDSFKEYLSIVSKFEMTVLAPKGYTLASDLSPVTDAYKKELAQVTILIEDLDKKEASERWRQLAAEIREKKARMKVEGRSPEQRAAEFATLNDLLSHRMVLLQPAKAKNNRSRLKLKARALALELELLHFEIAA